jgi:hypothetical protein
VAPAVDEYVAQLDAEGPVGLLEEPAVQLDDRVLPFVVAGER